MDGLNGFLVVLLGLVSGGHGSISGPELQMTITQGDNITLYCDCKLSSGVFIVWFRNCSHENQPSLVLRTKYMYDPSYLTKAYAGLLSPFPRLHFVKNSSSDSYDLLIVNITESDEGIYYCGTEKVDITTTFSDKYTYTYGNIMRRILLNSSQPHDDTHKTALDCGLCWKLLFSLCPTFAVISALFSSLLVYQLAQKKAEGIQDVRKHRGGQKREKQGEDMCYAAVEIRHNSKRPKMKETQSLCTYSTINTSRA